MNFKNEQVEPAHMQDRQALPRSRDERLLWIRRKVEDGYYEQRRVLKAVAEAFLDPPQERRAGDQIAGSRHSGLDG